MAPTRKGTYEQCSSCKFKTQEKIKYPCSKSHKEVRRASGQKLERNFTTCGIYEEA